MVLGALESDSLSPLSLPIWKSLAMLVHAWALFYLLSAMMLSMVGGVAVVAYLQIGIASPLIFAPLAAAAWFSYARLMGRMALLVMQQENRADDLHRPLRLTRHGNLAAVLD